MSACPFCHGEAELHRVSLLPGWVVRCVECGASGPPHRMRDDAIAGWCRRGKPERNGQTEKERPIAAYVPDVGMIIREAS